MKSRRTVLCLLALISLIPTLALAEEGRMGMMTQIQGKVFLHVKGEIQPARIMALITVGDFLTVTEGSEATFLLFTGERLRSQGKSEIRFDADGPKTISGAEPVHLAPLPNDALRILEDRVSETEPAHGAGVVFRSTTQEPAKLVLLRPVQTRIATQHPRFQWKAVPGNPRYRLTVSTLEGDPVWEETTNETALTYPEVAPRLEAGDFYFWDLRVFSEDSSALVAGSDFSLLAEDEQASLSHQRNRLMSLSGGPRDDPGPEIVLSMLYRDLELFDDAEIVLEDLAERFPSEKLIEEALEDLYLQWGRPREEASAN